MNGIDVLPIWAFFVGTIVVVLGSVEAGFRLGRAAHRRSDEEKESPVATMGGAVLGLVAFILAFTFGLAAARYDTRKQLVYEEANEIGTTYLRADFLPEAERAETKRLLREYVEVRLAAVESRRWDAFVAALGESVDLQDRLWRIAVANGARDLNSDVAALYADSLNAMIERHGERVTIAMSRIPSAIWASLYLISVLGMIATGYHSGITGSTRTPASAIVALCFALVISLIASLDRPFTAYTAVSQAPLVRLHERMTSVEPAPPAR